MHYTHLTLSPFASSLRNVLLKIFVLQYFGQKVRDLGSQNPLDDTKKNRTRHVDIHNAHLIWSPFASKNYNCSILPTKNFSPPKLAYVVESSALLPLNNSWLRPWRFESKFPTYVSFYVFIAGTEGISYCPDWNWKFCVSAESLAHFHIRKQIHEKNEKLVEYLKFSIQNNKHLKRKCFLKLIWVWCSRGILRIIISNPPPPPSLDQQHTKRKKKWSCYMYFSSLILMQVSNISPRISF